MAVLQWNAGGLRPSIAELQHIQATLCPLVACIQETKFAPASTIDLKGFTAYHHIHTENQIASGGTTIYTDNNSLHRQVHLKTTLQAIAVRVTLHRPITICSVYIPPNYPLKITQLNNLKLQLPKPFILLGDFNAHSPLWGDKPTDQKGKIIEDFLFQNNICLLNDKSPTYRNRSTFNTSSIDLTFCTPDLIPDLEWSVLDDRTDHFPILLKNNSLQNDPIPERFNFKKAHWDGFAIECSQILNPTFDLNYNKFHETLLEICHKHIPKTSPKPRKNKIWFSGECDDAVKKKKAAYRRAVDNNTPQNKINYLKARAEARRCLRESKRKSFQKYISQINSQTPLNKVFKIAKKFLGRRTDTIRHVQRPDGTTAETQVDIANTIATSLSKNSSKENYNTTFQHIKTNSEQQHLNFHSNNTETYNADFTLDELTSCISDLGNTAPGPDDIHNQIIKHLPSETLALLLDIYNDMWRSHSFPESWRLATVIPIPKPNKDHTQPSNYRPIALTSCLCKLIEKMIHRRLMWFLEATGSLSGLQCGFRKTRSTLDHLVRLETFIRETFAEGGHMIAIFFDLEKAFDTTWKYGILRDLHALGLRGHLPAFIGNFLKNRSFQVRVGSSLSDPHQQEEGVPQGSILSPLLFEIKINSIINTLQSGMDSSLYVDDFLICCRSRNPQIRSMERQLQTQLHKLEKWANNNGFKFAPSKTVAVHFCRSGRRVLQPDLTLYGERIPVQDQARFLGIIFDKKLTFIPHIKDLRVRCQKALNALKILSHPEWGGDSKHLLHLYISLVRSRLDYGCQVYGSAKPHVLKMLDPVQNQGLRLALGAFRTSPVESLQAEANIPSLTLRRKQLSLQYAIKQSSTPENPAHDCIFGTNPDTINKFKNNEKLIKPFGLRVLEDLKNIHFSKKDIQQFLFPDLPPWHLTKAKVDLQLTSHNKESTNTKTFKTEYKKLIEKYPGAELIFTDGSKSDSAVGAAALSSNTSHQRRLHPEASIFSAEATAIDMALDSVENSPNKSFLILSDSLSCITSLTNYTLLHPKIVRLQQKIHALTETGKNIVFAWLPSHVGIRGNEQVDLLAKESLSLLLGSTTNTLPQTDFKSKVKHYTSSLWKTHWKKQTNNKLYNVKPKLGPRKPSGLSRRKEVVFTRLRTGHASMTHRYLLRGDEKPFCVRCDTDSTIRHIKMSGLWRDPK